MARTLYTDQRRAAILQLLEQNASVSVGELAQVFDVSRVTIRTDLDILEKDGKLRRTHGGAVSLSRHITVSVQERRVNVNQEAKARIAQAAVQFVADGDTIFVDSGTTALAFMAQLQLVQHLTVITADLTVAEYVDTSLPNCEAVLLGGHLRKAHRYTAGPLTLAALASVHVDAAFMCPGSYIPGRGFMTEHEGMAQVKMASLEAARHLYALLDASKINARGLIRFADPHQFDALITDADTNGLLAEAVAGSDCRLILAS